MKNIYILLIAICLLLIYIVYQNHEILKRTEYSYIREADDGMWRITNGNKSGCLIAHDLKDVHGYFIDMYSDCLDADDYFSPAPENQP